MLDDLEMISLYWYLFVFGLFSDAFNSWNYVWWSEIMISEECEVTSMVPILTSVCWKWERWCKNSVSI